MQRGEKKKKKERNPSYLGDERQYKGRQAWFSGFYW